MVRKVVSLELVALMFQPLGTEIRHQVLTLSEDIVCLTELQGQDL